MKIALLVIVVLSIAEAQNSNRKASSNQLIDSIQGPDLFKAYCASCHGVGGTGDGPMVAALKTKPSDLTGIQKRNKGVFPLEKVQRVILGEEPGLAGHGSMEMPVWGPIFSKVTFTEKTGDVDLGRVRADNLARYLRGIQK